MRHGRHSTQQPTIDYRSLLDRGRLFDSIGISIPGKEIVRVAETVEEASGNLGNRFRIETFG